MLNVGSWCIEALMNFKSVITLKLLLRGFFCERLIGSNLSTKREEEKQNCFHQPQRRVKFCNNLVLCLYLLHNQLA